MHVFGLKCLPSPNGPRLDERYTVSTALIFIRSPGCRDEDGFIRSIPKGIWKDPALPRIFHPVMLISSPCLRFALSVMSDGVAVLKEEIMIF
jgi:hypothetical protein